MIVIRILFVDDSYLDIKICVYIYIAMVSYLWIDCKLAPSNYLSKLSLISLPIFLGLERRLNKPFDENSIFLAGNNLWLNERKDQWLGKCFVIRRDLSKARVCVQICRFPQDASILTRQIMRCCIQIYSEFARKVDRLVVNFP